MVVNYKCLSDECEDIILCDPYKGHIQMFASDMDYISSLHLCFDNSDIKYAFSNDDMWGEAGAQQISPFHYNMWLAFNNALYDNKVFLIESVYDAMEFFEKAVGFGVGVVFINSEYSSAVRFAKHIGFEIDEFTGSLFKMSRTFGGL